MQIIFSKEHIIHEGEHTYMCQNATLKLNPVKAGGGSKSVHNLYTPLEQGLTVKV